MVRQKRRAGRSILYAAMLFILAAVTACAGNGQQETASVQPQPQSQPQEEPEAAGAAPDNAAAPEEETAGVRVIEHAMGRTEIDGTPERVVTLFQGATDAALALGVQPAGAVEAWIEKPWYDYIRDRMEGVTNLGSENQPNLEAIVALHPDVIIASKTRHENISEQLSAIAPTVMTEEVHIWKDTLSLTAAALNKQAEEERLLAEWRAIVDEFKEKAKDKLTLEAGIVDFRTDHARIVYTGFSALVLEEFGIPRPAGQRGEEWGIQLASKEGIPQMDADMIFDQTSMDRDDGRVDLKKEWQEHPLWSNLRAVKSGSVYEVNTATWNNGSGPLAAMEMAKDLYKYYGLE